MAAGDGVSLPTTLAQMGNVAKAQAKGQQSVSQSTPFSGQVAREEDLQVRKVAEAEKPTGEKIDPNGQQPDDKRKRRRLKRNQKLLSTEDDSARGESEPPSPNDEATTDEQLGILIDMRV